MSDERRARDRFRRLDSVREFPRRCDHCAQMFTRDSRYSVIEVKGRNPLVVHEGDCARRTRGIADRDTGGRG